VWGDKEWGVGGPLVKGEVGGHCLHRGASITGGCHCDGDRFPEWIRLAGRERYLERTAILRDNHRSLSDEPAAKVEYPRGLKVVCGVGDLANP
jgi:hypothetical protein